MTASPVSPEALLPEACPFCNANLVLYPGNGDERPDQWQHPDTHGDCYLDGAVVYPEEVEAWNRRAVSEGPAAPTPHTDLAERAPAEPITWVEAPVPEGCTRRTAPSTPGGV